MRKTSPLVLIWATGVYDPAYGRSQEDKGDHRVLRYLPVICWSSDWLNIFTIDGENVFNNPRRGRYFSIYYNV